MLKNKCKYIRYVYVVQLLQWRDEDCSTFWVTKPSIKPVSDLVLNLPELRKFTVSRCKENVYIVIFVLKIYILADHMNMFSLPTQAFEQFAAFC